MRFAYDRRSSPASVSVPSREDRSMRRSPVVSSRRRMAWLTAGWVRRSFLAAREKLRSAATVAKTRRSSIVIMAAGKGTRMKSALPKVLHKIAGRPMLAHVIGTTASLGAARDIVITGHGA